MKKIAYEARGTTLVNIERWLTSYEGMYKTHVTLQGSMILRERCMHKYFCEIRSTEDTIMPTELTLPITMVGSRILKSTFFWHDVNLTEESVSDNHALADGVTPENLKQNLSKEIL